MPDCILLYAEFSCLVADEKALKEILCAKGASGLKFCPICYEICDHKTTDARATGCIRSTCLDVDTYKHHTDASVKAVLLELRRQHQSFMRGEITKMHIASKLYSMVGIMMRIRSCFAHDSA